jgi:hypothetical protein
MHLSGKHQLDRSPSQRRRPEGNTASTIQCVRTNDPEEERESQTEPLEQASNRPDDYSDEDDADEELDASERQLRDHAEEDAPQDAGARRQRA